MNAMVVLSQVESATPLVRWAARFAQMRKTSLTVLLCLFGEPSFPWEPVTTDHPAGLEELLQVTAEALNEMQDVEAHLFVTRHPAPAQTIIREIQKREIDFLCAGMDSTQPKDSPVNRLGRRLLRFAPC